MATTTDKLAPRIIINENEILPPNGRTMNHPTTLMFGFAPVGRTCEMVVCNSAIEIQKEFGFPVSAPEKWFVDAAMKVVENGGTALMTRLPYDNDQSHTVKYVDYRLEQPVAMKDLITVPQETKAREKDDVGVTILKEMHDLDERMTQYQRITQIQDDYGQHIFSMTNDQLVELDLDPQSNLDSGVFRIVDIRGEQYGQGPNGVQYTGIFPVIVSAPMAMYYQGRIQRSDELDRGLAILDLEEGIEMSTSWWRQSNPLAEETKEIQSEIVEGIDREVNFSTEKSRFQRGQTFQDDCVKRFPSLGVAQPGRLERLHLDDIGVLVCAVQWDPDAQKTSLVVLESFFGKLGRVMGSVDKKVNATSKYIRMYKNISVPVETDYFMADHQILTSLGMEASECVKYINYKTSIMDPIQYVLESVYSDVDSLQIDVVLDAGLSSTAFAAYVARNEEGETFVENPEVRTRVDWSANEYPMQDYAEKAAYVWSQTTKMLGDFCRNVRGDCVYIADGPRIMNLERNYPIQNYIDEENTDMFNRYLPLFNGYTNNYVARYWNWTYIEDMQWENRGFWVPGSVVMGGQLGYSDHSGQVWYAPAGQNRGVVSGAYNVSVRTKQYNSENDLLYSNQWNFFQIYQNEGVVVEGQKTLQTKKTSLDRLNTRRMVCWIKQQARMIANRYKYEPHTKSARDGFRKELAAMLETIRKTSGISDYIVVCDETNNSIESIDRHELWCKIGIKPIKAIEYIIIDLDIVNGSVGLRDGGSQVIKSRA